MALERLTQITEVGIQSGITLRNVNVEGAFVSGVVTATTLNVTGGGANFAGVVTATSFSGNVTGNITPTGLVVSGVSTFQASSFWGDGDIAYFGDGQDLLIFHNSTDSIIRDNGTGDLYIEGGNRIRLTNPTGIETYGVFNQDGAVELYHDNVKRLETSGIGVSITSALTVGTGASVSSPATNVLTLGTNNVESVRIDSSGRVGINTITPSSPLDVVSDSNGLCSRLYGRASDSIGTLQFRDNSNTTTYGYLQGRSTDFRIATATTNPILFLTDNTSERARITGVGSFGIGTANPTTKLEIVGAHSSGAITTSFKISGSGWSLGGGPSLEFGHDPASYPTWVTGRIASTYSGSSWGGGLKFFYNNGTTAATLTEGMELTRDGNLAFPSGKGIDFSAAGNAAGMTSELLDDYEEGTFTASFSGSTFTTTGYYTKVGRLVHIHLYASGINVTSTTGAVVSGLPFTIRNDYSTGAANHNTYTTNGDNFYFTTNGTSMLFYQQNTISQANTNLGNPRYVMMSGCYTTDT